MCIRDRGDGLALHVHLHLADPIQSAHRVLDGHLAVVTGYIRYAIRLLRHYPTPSVRPNWTAHRLSLRTSHVSMIPVPPTPIPVSYTHLRAHETVLDLVCRILLEKKKKTIKKTQTI